MAEKSEKNTPVDSTKAQSTKPIELPVLTPDEEWMDKVEGVEKPPEKIKRFIYLPAIAYKTAVHANEKNLSKAQKKILLLSFRAETDKVRGLIDTQVSMSVGNSSSDRIGYLKDFESWQKRLFALLQEAFGRVSEPLWIEKLESLTNDPLLHINRQEWEEKIKNHLRLFLKIFKKDLYFEKFEEFTYEALKLIRFGSAMMEITMERPEWMFQAMKNTGFLPANQKYKKPLEKNNELQKKIEEIVSGELKRPVAELKAILEEVKKEASKTELAVGSNRVKTAKTSQRKPDDITNSIQERIKIFDDWMNITSANNDLGSAVDTTGLRGSLVGFDRTVLSIPDNICQRTRKDTENAYYALYDILEADYNTTTGNDIMTAVLEFRKQLGLCQTAMMNNNQKPTEIGQGNKAINKPNGKSHKIFGDKFEVWGFSINYKNLWHKIKNWLYVARRFKKIRELFRRQR